jgi:DNA-binding response OmpR family regulator
VLPSEILIVSADRQFLQTFQAELQSQGFSIKTQDKLLGLVETLRVRLPHLLILDLDLTPDPPWDQISALRQDPHTTRLPIVAVSGLHTAPRHVILGLRMGVVDYIPKICDPKVLAARLQALLHAMERRGKREVKESLLKSADGRLILDIAAHKCRISSDSAVKEVRLTPKEFMLLEHLMAHRNRLVAKEDLLRFLWPMDPHQKENVATLAQYIAHLRRKLGPLKEKLKTVWGLGFRFDD